MSTADPITDSARGYLSQDYVFEGSRRAFASLWQRALAQLVDAVPLGAGFLLPMAWMWRGKTPGKWLLRIRVLGTDLRPCGFGRALLRNLLTFADGFFNFLVGMLLVALTENWQRLGDLAARTIVVADEKPA